jgi:hypothetical protein
VNGLKKTALSGQSTTTAFLEQLGEDNSELASAVTAVTAVVAVPAATAATAIRYLLATNIASLQPDSDERLQWQAAQPNPL